MDSTPEQRWLQPTWDRIRIGNEGMLASPLFYQLFNVVLSFGVSLFYLVVIDLWLADYDFMKRYKIQKDKKVTWPLVKSAFAAFGDTTYSSILSILIPWIILPLYKVPVLAPTATEFLVQVTLSLVLYDFFYGAFHLLCHKVKWLYRWCHSVHHRYTSPFVLAAGSLHWFEQYALTIFITGVPLLLDMHPLANMTYLWLIMFMVMESHCGYDFPFMPARFLPFLTGAAAHDMHHMRPLTSFQPLFNYFDRIMGTYMTNEEMQKMNAKMRERYGKYEEKDVIGVRTDN